MRLLPRGSEAGFRGWLLWQVPVCVGLMSGIFVGVQVAPSPLLAALVTLGCGLLGMGIGTALINW